MSQLLQRIGYDRKQLTTMKNIYEKKTEVMKYERLIYSEMILLNPTILASVILNSAKGNVIIKFYYTKKHETHNVQITIE